MRAFTIAPLFTTSFTLPHANGWRGRGGRITLMVVVAGSTYRGVPCHPGARPLQDVRTGALLPWASWDASKATTPPDW